MLKLLIRRLLLIVPILLGISVITFGLIRLVPGDPVEILLRQGGLEPTKDAIESYRKELGLDAPIYLQYIHWLNKIVYLDLGTSFRTGELVTKELIDRLPSTLKLTLSSFVFMLLISLPIGIISVLKQSQFIEHLSRAWAILCISMPTFWLGPLLIYFFSVKLRIFPVVGQGEFKDMVLPAITLGLGMASVYSRIVRERIIEVLTQDYIKLAYTKGLSEWEIIHRHILKNTLLPLITLWGMSLGYLLGGAVIVENIFAWPGLGKLAVEAILNRDYPVIQGYALFMALVFVFINLIMDIIYCFLDPRIKVGIENNGR